MSKLTFILKNDVDKLAVMLWVLAIFLLLAMSRELLCTDACMYVNRLQCMYVNAFIIPMVDSNIGTNVAVGRFVWEHLPFYEGGELIVQNTKAEHYFHSAFATVVCKSYEVRKHFTSLKANILSAV